MLRIQWCMQPLLARIFLPSVRFNANYFKKLSSRPLIAVVKDDAYGHGAEEVAHCLHHIASSFAVATVEEGVSLRIAGIMEDILVLTPPMTVWEGERLLLYDLTASVTSFPALSLLARAAERTGTAPNVHLAVNTGMNRYGVAAEEVKRAVKAIKERGLSLTGVFSHYFEAGNADGRERQNELFADAVSSAKESFPACSSHIAATGGVWNGENASDAVRVGLGLYGYLPDGTCGPLRRAMRLYAFVSNSCRQTGEGLGYAFADKNYGRVHTLRLGYGDGFFREGHDNIVGKLCMDAALSAGGAAFGKRVPAVTDFGKYAAAHGTSVYEALVRLSGKAVREYIR